MQRSAPTVEAYLASLPEDRRSALQVVRKVILANLDPGFEEGMQYGMIGYYVPHRIHPAGYHCDPKQPLPFAGLASQKQAMSLYLLGLYGDDGERARFEAAWKATGKKLDMGKSCLRFRKVEDLALDVIGATLRRVTARGYATRVQELLAKPRKPRPKAGTEPAAKAAGASTATAPAKKASPKR